MKKQHFLLGCIILLTFLLSNISCSRDNVQTTSEETISEDLSLQKRTEMVVEKYYDYEKQVFLNWTNRKQINFPLEIFADKGFAEKHKFKALQTGESSTGFKYNIDLVFDQIQETDDFYILGVTKHLSYNFIIKPNMVMDFLAKDHIENTDASDRLFYIFDKKSERIVDIYQGRIDQPLDMPFPGFESELIMSSFEAYQRQLNKESALTPQISDVEKQYLEGNIEIDQLLSMTKESKRNTVQKSQNYNASSAVSYALNHAYNYNNGYFNYANQGTDCANFMSQCLKAGGFSFEGSSVTSCNSWWYDNNGTSSTNDDTASQTWTTANGLYRYLAICGDQDTYSLSDARIGSPADARKGDLLFLNFSGSSSGIRQHSLIVTYAWQWNWQSVRKIKITAHTSNRRNALLTIYEDSFDVWDFKFVEM